MVPDSVFEEVPTFFTVKLSAIAEPQILKAFRQPFFDESECLFQEVWSQAGWRFHHVAQNRTTLIGWSKETPAPRAAV